MTCLVTPSRYGTRDHHHVQRRRRGATAAGIARHNLRSIGLGVAGRPASLTVPRPDQIVKADQVRCSKGLMLGTPVFALQDFLNPNKGRVHGGLQACVEVKTLGTRWCREEARKRGALRPIQNWKMPSRAGSAGQLLCRALGRLRRSPRGSSSAPAKFEASCSHHAVRGCPHGATVGEDPSDPTAPSAVRPDGPLP